MSQNVLDALQAHHGPALERVETQHGDEIACVKREHVIAVVTWLRSDDRMLFDAPVFVTCIDRLDWRPVVQPGTPWPNGGNPIGGTAVTTQPRTGRSPVGSADRGAQPGDDPESMARFEVCYQLRSTTHLHRIRIKIAVPENDPRCPSLAALYPAFEWQERETFDMYGIRFENHPDLRRIYLYEEFVGHPLRKDYPKEKRQPLVRRDDLPINPIKANHGER